MNLLASLLRRDGDALVMHIVALVRDGSVEPADAWRGAPNRDLLLAALGRDGVETTVMERYA